VPSDEERLADVPLWELIQTSWVVARGFAQVFAEAGLSPGQFGALQCLVDHDGLTQADIARQLMMRPQSLGEVVTSLVARGFVRRDGPAGRGRRAGLSLTEQGRATLRRAGPGARAFNAPEAIGLTPAQTTTLVQLLRTVRHTLSTNT
jgi:DNA-binding MarR family transcriptional regulator